MIPLKNQQEKEKMRQSGCRLAQVMNEALLLVKPGLSLFQLDQAIEKLILKKGGQPSFKMVPDYHWASCLNINQGVVHGVPNDYCLKVNDLLSIDIGIFYQGFHTDMARTVIVGKGNKQLNLFLATGKKALKKAIGAVKDGHRVGHLSLAMEKELRQAGLSPVETLTGHGVGRKLHEEPQIPCRLWGSVKETPRLKAGMSLALEVIYAQGKPDLILGKDNWTIETEDGRLSGLFEDTVLVGKEKAEVLTTLN